MSIETLLTVALALAILIAAAALRWMTLGILDLVLRLRGHETRRRSATTEPRATPAASGRLHQASRRVLEATVAATTRAVAELARYTSEIRRVTAATTSGVYARVAPATERAMATSSQLVVEGARRATAQILVVTTALRHLAQSAYRAARELWTTTDPPRAARRPQPPVERSEPEPEPRVIDLNRQWDPLTDPFDPEDTLTWSR